MNLLPPAPIRKPADLNKIVGSITMREMRKKRKLKRQPPNPDTMLLSMGQDSTAARAAQEGEKK